MKEGRKEGRKFVHSVDSFVSLIVLLPTKHIKHAHIFGYAQVSALQAPENLAGIGHFG